MIRVLLETVRGLLTDRNLALVGSTALVLALGVALSPTVAAVLRPAAGFAGPGTVLLFGGLAGLLGLWSLKRTVGEGSEDAGLWTPATTPERAHYDEQRTTGTAVDAVLDGEDDEQGVRQRAWKRIRRTAVTVLADAENCSRQVARGRIDDGSWTDDPRAAAFLARSPSLLPLRTRVRDWASGEAYERRARRAVAEIEVLTSTDPTPATAGASERGDSPRSLADAAGLDGADESDPTIAKGETSGQRAREDRRAGVETDADAETDVGAAADADAAADTDSEGDAEAERAKTVPAEADGSPTAVPHYTADELEGHR
ncbi:MULTISPECIES: DUF7269 family protein [Halorussus]|uniref:DUF7269 family protein n=1 Tax=Halorussus TaxID=1070314 RepID=UPI00209D7676|nr:hypothetical protein [Halorussus vallis]USZ77917.1 hypothetical protein NGM07_22315 [Halorussus vallis]